MNRLPAILLIPLLACGNVFPHTHGMANAPSDHAQRPHIHIDAGSNSHDTHPDGHHHHHGDDESAGKEVANSQSPVDHDSDAIYLGSGHAFLPSSVGSIVDSAQECVGVVAANDYFSVATARTRHAVSAVANRGGPPLFLLHAALRL